MRTTLLNFLFMRVQNATALVGICLGLVWLLLLGSALVSICSQSRSLLWKTLWIFTVIVFPFFGMFLYCCYCIRTADFAFLRQFGVRKKARQLKFESFARSTKGEAV
jgi:hypothetical protein